MAKEGIRRSPCRLPSASTESSREKDFPKLSDGLQAHLYIRKIVAPGFIPVPVFQTLQLLPKRFFDIGDQGLVVRGNLAGVALDDAAVTID